jgi:proline dehydrogenase
MEKIMKNAFLYLSKNKAMNKMAQRYGLRLGAKRFVAGVTLSEAINSVKELNQKGIMATLDHLGEFVATKEEAKASMQACLKTLEEIAQNKVKANLSVKMTQLGLDLDESFCISIMKELLNKAKSLNLFVRIDMEDFTRNEKSIRIFQLLRQEFDNVGIVIQAYLYKSEEDVGKLKANLRICKGAYKENEQVAFPQKSDVDANYLKLVKKQLLSGCYVGIATHDDNMIGPLKTFIAENHIALERFEFQMLYGIRTDLQEQLVNEGYRVRAYVPYGTDWYGYFMRRLAERPANVTFVLKSLFK